MIGAKKNFKKRNKDSTVCSEILARQNNSFRPYSVIKFGRNQIETLMTRSLSDVRITLAKRIFPKNIVSLNGRCDKRQGEKKLSFSLSFSNR